MRLTEHQCGIILRELREFGYPSLKLQTVMEQANKVADGEDVSGNVIGMFVRKFIEDMESHDQ